MNLEKIGHYGFIFVNHFNSNWFYLFNLNFSNIIFYNFPAFSLDWRGGRDTADKFFSLTANKNRGDVAVSFLFL